MYLYSTFQEEPSQWTSCLARYARSILILPECLLDTSDNYFCLIDNSHWVTACHAHLIYSFPHLSMTLWIMKAFGRGQNSCLRDPQTGARLPLVSVRIITSTARLQTQPPTAILIILA